MSKRMTRVLSLILTLVMFVSVSTPAFAWGGGDLGSGWDREIGEDEVREFDGPVVEDEEALDYFHTIDNETLLEVTVEAPMGSLPMQAELRAEPVEIEDVREAVESVVEGEANILLAMDISFWMNGIEIEPEQPVSVKIGAPELADKTNLTLVHIPDAAEPETIELIDDEDLGFALGTTEIAFKANSFSVYVIVDGEPNPPVTETYRRTYKFTTDGTTPFEFYNKAGKKVTEQIVKTGDTLEAVTLPYSASHTFQNWVVSASDDALVAEGTAINLPVVINDDINSNKKDTTVTLMPAYGNVYYVSFHAQDLPLADGDPDIILTKKIVVEGEYVVIGDIVAPQLDDSHIFYGWTTKTDGSEPFTSIYDEDNQQVTTTKYPDPVEADMDLYPHFVEAYWLRFVANGLRASYVPAMFAMTNQTLTTLPVSSRTGYTFDGWYTVEENEDGTPVRDDDGNVQFKTQITDGEGNVINPADGLTLTKETVLYGHWTANDNSPYTVVIWRQKVSDDKDATKKTYDYAESRSDTGVTDDPVGPSQADISHSGDAYTGFHYARTVQTSSTIRADGSTVINVYYDRDLKAINFYYQSDHAPDGASTAYQYQRTNNTSGTLYGLKPDGTYALITGEEATPQRVYYTYGGGWSGIPQTEYTGTFYTRRNNGSYWNPDYVYTASEYNGSNLPPQNSGTTFYTGEINGEHYQLTRQIESATYSWKFEDGTPYIGDRFTRSEMSGYKMVTWTGLWEQSFDQNKYTWPASIRWREGINSGTTQTMLGGFVKSDSPYVLYDNGSSGENVIYHYRQTLAGDYKQTAGNYTEAHMSNSTVDFTFENKFEGFKVSKYSTRQEGFIPSGGSHNATGSLDDYTLPLYVYHTRNKWNITYMSTRSAADSQMVEVHSEKDIYFEAPLTVKNDQGEVTKTYNLSLQEVGLTERDHYTFTGWYADPACTTLYDFSGTMPNANVVVYAGWEPVWYQIIVDPDGGEITQAIGATYFWKKYGETFDAYVISRNYIEDPNGEYEYVYVDGENDTDGNIPSENRTATYVKQNTGKTKYRLIKPGVDPTYTLVGWYVVDEKDKTTSTPYDFGSEVENPVKIRAVWNLGGDYGLFYNPSVTVTVKPAEGETPAVTRDVTGTVTQNSDRYADGAEVVIGAPPTDITNGFVFDGWEVVEPDTPDGPGKVLDDNGGKYYQPGKDLKLNAALWARNRTIFLRAHYTPVEGSDQPIGVTYLQFKPNFPADAKVTNGEETDVKYYPLNTAIDLANDEFVPTDYTAGGYKLIGWSQNKDAEPVVHAEGAGLGEIVFGLKDTIGVDAITPTEKATFVKEDGEEIEVDCNVLYAIWAPVYFYVYHSSDNTVEKIQMPVNDAGTFDITSLVKADYMYGGYYSDYGKKGDYDITKPAEYTSAVSGSTPYVGGIGPWKAGNAITSSKGTEMKPEVDKTYFLKEVPNDFLKSILYVIYDARNVEKKNLIVHNYLIADVDDNNYDKIGLIARNITTGDRIKLALSYTINDNFNNKTDKINAASFGAQKGYVAVWKPDVATGNFDYVPFFVTPDGVTVEGANVRYITWGDGTYQEWKTPGVTFELKANDKISNPGQISTREG